MRPLYVFCGTGDHLWGREREPVDSPAAIDAMLTWMAQTYGVTRLYWRGGQSMMWDEYMKMGKETVPQYDWTTWKHYLYRTLKINEAAVAAARRHGMETFLYTGLFEFGVQPDIGIVGPYLFEDRLRREHPEWCPQDRWGERRCAGPIEFCYPEARTLVVERYVEHVERYGYSGMNFYTYVENCAIRYEDEFGFNQPVVDAFNKAYPDVDLRKDKLTGEQKEHWYRCRGAFVTEFLRELHAALAAKGKKLSVILDAANPDYAQPWWGKPIAGTGKIHMDWRTWVDEGIVDELWVQLGPVAAQRQTLDLLLEACAGKPVKLTVRAVEPFDSGWKPYVRKGVTPIAVITWARNGIERFSTEPVGPNTLNHRDWKRRLQTVADVEAGKLHLDPAPIAALAKDPHLLVRRRVMLALAALGAAEHADVLHEGLFDPESCVLIAAAGALAKIPTAASPQQVFKTLGKDGHFQMKAACVDALTGMGERAFPQVIEGLGSPHRAVREVCVRVLYKAGKAGRAGEVYDPLRRVLLDPAEDERVRYYALDRLVGLRLELVGDRQQQLAADLMALARDEPSTTVQLRAAWGLGYMYGMLEGKPRGQALTVLSNGFRRYGDGCERSDAAFGWRVFGNAMLQFHDSGRSALEAMRQQAEDKWLAWLAYETVHLPHRHARITPVEEAEAIRIHNAYAPPFPGRRTW